MLSGCLKINLIAPPKGAGCLRRIGVGCFHRRLGGGWLHPNVLQSFVGAYPQDWVLFQKLFQEIITCSTFFSKSPSDQCRLMVPCSSDYLLSEEKRRIEQARVVICVHDGAQQCIDSGAPLGFLSSLQTAAVEGISLFVL